MFVPNAIQIKKFREELELSQRKLARVLGVTQMTIHRWEKGESCPNVTHVAKMLALGRERGVTPEFADTIPPASSDERVTISRPDSKRRPVEASRLLRLDQLPSRVMWIDRFADERVAFETDRCVCLQKLFPLCASDHMLPEQHYRRFHLRYYLPRETVIDAEKQLDKIVVMTNGLDEISAFTLYDEIGSRLASHGLAAVLLPLPDHLNRHTRFRIPNPTPSQLLERPSEIILREPLKLYSRYLQFRQELGELVDHLRGTGCRAPKGPCSFYRNLFAPHTRVSYLGYSLGATAMLCDFLERAPSELSINACILLSGWLKLQDVLPRGMFEEELWTQFTRQLVNQFDQYQPPTQGDDQTVSRLFSELFLGHEVRLSKQLLKLVAPRVLFLFGGRDRTTTQDGLRPYSPAEWGLCMLALPGIDHFLAIDEEWKKWITLIEKLITEFEENAQRHAITERELLRHWKVLQGQSEAKGLETLQADHYVRRALIMRRDPERIAHIDSEKRLAKELLRSKPLSQLRIGEALCRTDLIKFEDLTEALELQKSHGGRLGDILVDQLKVVRREHLEVLAAEQAKSQV